MPDPLPPAADPAVPVPSSRTNAPTGNDGPGALAAQGPEALPRLALHLQAVLHAHGELATAADALVGELAQHYGAERVSIGLRERGSVRLLAASAELEHAQGAGRVRALEHAMDEAADQAAVIHYPAEPAAAPRITALHAQYARAAHSQLASVPLVDTDRVIGVIAFEYRPDAALPSALAQVPDVLAPLAPLLALRRLAEARGLARWRLQRERWTPDQRRRRVIAWTAAGLAVLVGCFPVADRIGAPARVEGEVQRALVAPVDGFIGAVHARPGDPVRSGQVVAELAREDLELERDRWSATLAQHENAYRNALVRGERAQYATSIARAAEAQAELERIQAQIERSRLIAPFDGLIIRGDLSQSLGAPVRRGETLLTIAPAGRHRVIAEVDEKDIERLRQGTRGTVVLAALPDLSIAVEVRRLSPAAVSRDGRTFYEVEANPASEHGSLRPGLQGQVRFDGGRSPLAIALGRRVLDWVRLSLWSVGAWIS